MSNSSNYTKDVVVFFDELYKNNTYLVGILIKDLEHIEKFKRDIKATGIIKKATTPNNFYLEIYNTKFAKNLMNNGVVIHKTKILNFPTLKPNLIRHFIRGFFDGDGCICCTEKTISFHICCASEQFLISLTNILNALNISTLFNIYKRKDGLLSIVTSSFETIEEIRKYLYNDSEIFLSRKKLIFDFILNNKDEIRKKINENRRKRIH